MSHERTVVVAGAAGFIGSNITRALIEQEGYNVVGVDNFITGSESNVDSLSQFPEFRFIEQDIKDPINISGEIEAVYDFACPASPADFDRFKMQILEANCAGIYNLLDLARAKEAMFIFSSSSEVYGDAEITPQNESYNGNVNTTGIRSIYDEGKRFGESMTMTFHREYGLPTRIVRIFNTYGVGMHPNDSRAIPMFIKQALRGDDLTIFGDGTQTRSPQYITDLVEGILRLAKSKVIEPVNIGNPDEYTINDIAQRIVEIVDSGSKLVYQPLPHIHDPKQRRPDIEKAKNELGWMSTTPFSVGLNKTIDWFRFRKIED